MDRTYFEPHHKKQLEAWMNWNEITCRVLFRGSEQGHTPQAFHTACDNKGPTIVLIKLGKGTLFGGYTSANWDSSNTSVVDNTAFLFQLYPTVKRYPVAAGSNAITKNANSGPIFGTTDLIVYQTGVPPGVNSISSTLAATYPFVATPGNAAIQANNALAGTVPPYGLADVEIIQILPSTFGETPLVHHIDLDCAPDAVEKLRHEVSCWEPSISNLLVTKANVLFVGALGAGKSATINTIVTALSDGSGIRHIAASRNSTVSVTRKLLGYDLSKLAKQEKTSKLAKLILLDSAGWSGASYPGMDLLLDGRIPHDNSVVIGDANLFDSRGPTIRAELNVTYSDSVHCVVYVVPYAQLANLTTYCQSLIVLIDEVTSRGLSSVAVITGIDADELVHKRGVFAAYASNELHEARKKVASELRLNPGQVYLLKNYQEESQPNLQVDALTLFFTRGIQQNVDSMFDSIALGLQHIRNMPPKKDK